MFLFEKWLKLSINYPNSSLDQLIISTLSIKQEENLLLVDDVIDRAVKGEAVALKYTLCRVTVYPSSLLLLLSFNSLC